MRLFPALLAVLVLAAPAHAASLHGTTGHGLRVTVRTDESGAARKAVFYWRVRSCDRGRYRFTNATGFSPDAAPPTRIGEGNAYWVREGALRTRVVAHVSGHRVSIYRWEGTFSASAKITRRGRVLDRCHFRRQHWRATTPRGRVELSGDRDDYILHGQSLSFVTPSSRIRAQGDRHGVVIYAGDSGDIDYNLVVRAPGNNTLKPGHYPRARDATLNGNRPGLELSGSGRSCSIEIAGEFTITRAKFDGKGPIVLSGSFVQHCDGREAAARGTFSYHR